MNVYHNALDKLYIFKIDTINILENFLNSKSKLYRKNQKVNCQCEKMFLLKNILHEKKKRDKRRRKKKPIINHIVKLFLFYLVF